MNSQSNLYIVFFILQSSNHPGTRNAEDGILVEHWDVIQDEATQEQSKSGLPMFGAKIPGWGRADKSTGVLQRDS